MRRNGPAWGRAFKTLCGPDGRTESIQGWVYSVFSLLVFRHAARRFFAQSVMCYLHTPSLAHHAACLTKNFRR